jgi:hypothetical protein
MGLLIVLSWIDLRKEFSIVDGAAVDGINTSTVREVDAP